MYSYHFHGYKFLLHHFSIDDGVDVVAMVTTWTSIGIERGCKEVDNFISKLCHNIISFLKVSYKYRHFIVCNACFSKLQW